MRQTTRKNDLFMPLFYGISKKPKELSEVQQASIARGEHIFDSRGQVYTRKENGSLVRERF